MVLNEVLMEIQRVGNALRVCAMDADTGTEIVFQAPMRTGKAELQKLAMKKLEYVLKKRDKDKKDDKNR